MRSSEPMFLDHLPYCMRRMTMTQGFRTEDWLAGRISPADEWTLYNRRYEALSLPFRFSKRLTPSLLVRLSCRGANYTEELHRVLGSSGVWFYSDSTGYPMKPDGEVTRAYYQRLALLMSLRIEEVGQRCAA